MNVGTCLIFLLDLYFFSSNLSVNCIDNIVGECMAIHNIYISTYVSIIHLSVHPSITTVFRTSAAEGDPVFVVNRSKMGSWSLWTLMCVTRNQSLREWGLPGTHKTCSVVYITSDSLAGELLTPQGGNSRKSCSKCQSCLKSRKKLASFFVPTGQISTLRRCVAACSLVNFFVALSQK